MAVKRSEYEVVEYFRKTAPKVGMEKLVVRTTNSLLRGGIDTMEKLCAIDEESLLRLRSMGVRTKAFAMLVREKYQSEQNIMNANNNKKGGNEYICKAKVQEGPYVGADSGDGHRQLRKP